MTQVHVVIRRINPALKVDFVQVGYIKDGQFESLHLDTLARTPISDYVKHSTISASPYLDHSQKKLLCKASLSGLRCFKPRSRIRDIVGSRNTYSPRS